MSVRKLAARIGLLGLVVLMVIGGEYGAVGLASTAAGATAGSPSPPPHPNV